MFGLRLSYLVPLALLVLLIAAGLIRITSRKLGRNLRTSSVTWRFYLKGQGTLLFLFLLIGGVLALSFDRLGPSKSKVLTGGQLIQLREVNPSDHPIYEELDVENYSRIVVLTKASSPDNGSASITAYIDQGPEGKSPIEHIDCVSAFWSEWQTPNRGKHLSLVATPPIQSGAIPATKIDILIYLSPR